MWNLLWALAALFVVLWIVGLALKFTMGGLIHILLVLAVVSLLARVIMGARRHRTA